MIDLELQVATNAKTLPHPSLFKSWVSVILEEIKQDVELSIRIVDESEIIDLNKRYRNKNKPTNVLSFPIDLNLIGFELDYCLLGDIIICAQVVEAEAKSQNKDLLAHWAHMVVHGVLHLLGYDHIEEDEAQEMESLEIELLKKLGFNSPY